MAQTAKIFKNGRSQAVRLPKEFRFAGNEVEIRRDATTGEVVLAPKDELQASAGRKKPVRREDNRAKPGGNAAVEPEYVRLGLPTLGERQLSLEELYAIFDQVEFPDDFFNREVRTPRELDLF